MNKIIVIGDIHNHWAEAEQIASLYEKTHRIVFVGDYFDDFGDTAQDALQTAQWLKSSLQKPNRVHIMGNHDINYSYLNYVKDSNGSLQNIYNCSGYSMQKDDAINRVMLTQDWDKLTFAHFENGFWFTHAGIHPYWFEHPIKGMNDDVMSDKLSKARDDYNSRIWNETIGAVGRCRGGSHKQGGILWLDSQRETVLIPSFRQVYGHTPTMGRISIWDDPDFKSAVNINVDCGLSQVLEIDEEGNFSVIDTDYPNFYYQQRQKQVKKFLNNIEYGAYDKIYEQLNKQNEKPKDK